MNTRLNIKYLYGLLLLFTTITVSCEKLDEIEPVDNLQIYLNSYEAMDYATGAYVVYLTDTLTFSIKGQLVDNILFYSGALGEEFRYRNRFTADNSAVITPQVRVKTGIVGTLTTDIASTTKVEMCMAFDKDIPQFNDAAVAAANWSAVALRGDNTNTAAMTEYYDFSGAMSSSNSNADYSDWRSHNEVVYCIKAKSNKAVNNRMQLQGFYVSNTETRDYGYTYNGITVTNKQTKEYKIFESYSVFDSNLKISNTETGACWAMYTPLTTIKEGETTPVANSQHYAFNAAQFGLKYGELTGAMPWVMTNKFGQDIKGAYNVEMWQPNKNYGVDESGTEITSRPVAWDDEPCESWLVSRAHNVHQVAPDIVSAYVKTKTQVLPANFKYSFGPKGKGLYTITFYANTQNHKNTHEYVKEFKILVK